MKPMQRRQRGATLIIALILLVMLTLFSVTSFNLGTSSLKTVGNMQHRNEAMAAAQQAVEEAASTTRLFDTPSAVILNGDATCKGGAPNTKCVDVNGDGKAEITVTLYTPKLVRVQPRLLSDLDVKNRPADQGCSTAAQQNMGVGGTSSGNSLCADSMWEVTAVAQDNVTGAQYSVTEGLGVQVDITKASSP